MEQESPQDHFQQAYQQRPPWEVGRAQRALANIAPRVQGTVLDIGCGTGDNAIFFAQCGHCVYGIDFISEPIVAAKSKAAKVQTDVCFLVMDALQLDQLPILFDNVIDCGLFHVLSDDDRARYVDSIAGVLRPGGVLWLMCFSDREPPGAGPRRVSEPELRAAFTSPWEIVSIEPSQFETAPHVPPGTFSDGGPLAHLAVIRRSEG